MSKKITVFIAGDDRQLQKSIHAAQTGGEKLKSSFGKIGSAIGGAFAAGGLAAFAGSAIQAAAHLEASQAQLARVLHNTTGATKEQSAAVDEYLQKTALATGISQSQLTPVFTRLIGVTHNVGKAQRLLNDAMNASAATGKPLATVAQALGRAYNGTVGGLGRLGLATKDAQGHTLKFAAVQALLEKNFKGAAATAADTFSGKMNRLKVQFQVIEEKVGAKLIPILSKLAAFFLKNEKVIVAVAGAIVSLFVIEKIVSFVKAAQAAFAALNVVLAANPIILVVAAIAALVIGLVYAYNHFKAFREAVQATFGFLKAAATGIISFFKGHWKEALLIALTGPVGLAIVVFKRFGPDIVKALGKVGQVIWKGVTKSFDFLKTQIKNAVTAYVNFYIALPRRVVGALVTFGQVVWKGIVASVSFLAFQFAAAVGSYVSFFASLPFRIIGALAKFGAVVWKAIGGSVQSLAARFGDVVSLIIGVFSGLQGSVVAAIGDAGSWLYNIGSDILHGLVRGATAALNDVKNFFGGIASKIVSWKGPVEYDRTILHPAGIAIMEGLIAGTRSRLPHLKVALHEVTGAISGLGMGGGAIGGLTLARSSAVDLTRSQPATATHITNVTLNAGWIANDQQVVKRIRDALVTGGRHGGVSFKVT